MYKTGTLVQTAVLRRSPAHVKTTRRTVKYVDTVKNVWGVKNFCPRHVESRMDLDRTRYVTNYRYSIGISKNLPILIWKKNLIFLAVLLLSIGILILSQTAQVSHI